MLSKLKLILRQVSTWWNCHLPPLHDQFTWRLSIHSLHCYINSWFQLSCLSWCSWLTWCKAAKKKTTQPRRMWMTNSGRPGLVRYIQTSCYFHFNWRMMCLFLSLWDKLAPVVNSSLDQHRVKSYTNTDTRHIRQHLSKKWRDTQFLVDI